MLRTPEAVIIEESAVDPKRRIMVTRTRNLTHRAMMHVEETQIYRPHPLDGTWYDTTLCASACLPTMALEDVGADGSADSV